jgi:hypothetical protein
LTTSSFVPWKPRKIPKFSYLKLLGFTIIIAHG